jgi:transcriptional regulator with XRE-family HTH domain
MAQKRLASPQEVRAARKVTDEGLRMVGSALYGARKHRRYSLRQVQQQTGVPNAHLSQIERGGIRNPKPELLWRLSEFYGLNYDLLAGWAGYEPRLARLRGELLDAVAELDGDELAAALREVKRIRGGQSSGPGDGAHPREPG